jgi:hypothetical protein
MMHHLPANIEEKSIINALEVCKDVMVHHSENDRSTPAGGVN